MGAYDLTLGDSFLLVGQPTGTDIVLGVLLVGIWFNTYLYGIVTYQFAAYWRTRKL